MNLFFFQFFLFIIIQALQALLPTPQHVAAAQHELHAAVEACGSLHRPNGWKRLAQQFPIEMCASCTEPRTAPPRSQSSSNEEVAKQQVV